MIPVRHLAALAIAAVLVTGLSGCATDRAQEVPSTAQLGAEGNGHLSYVAPEDGTVYVYDVPGDRIIYSTPVKKGEQLTVAPEDRRILVDGRIVSEDTLRGTVARRIFFAPVSVVERRTTTYERVDERRP